MSRERIRAIEDSAAVLLPKETLDALGVKVGDELNLSIDNGALILRPLEDTQRVEKLEGAIKSVFERRKSVFEELAKGA
ncbi:MAG: AbrB/MazE/SpoVT family DNA-binding domain-containing protein [Pyrinomonadaceae bacterium]